MGHNVDYKERNIWKLGMGLGSDDLAVGLRMWPQSSNPEVRKVPLSHLLNSLLPWVQGWYNGCHHNHVILRKLGIPTTAVCQHQLTGSSVTLTLFCLPYLWDSECGDKTPRSSNLFPAHTDRGWETAPASSLCMWSDIIKFQLSLVLTIVVSYPTY